MSTRATYGGLTAAVLVVEVLIAAFVHDAVVRPFVGDALVVVLLFCALRTVLNRAPGLALAGGVLVLACAVEVSQAFDLVGLLGMADNRLVSTILGRTFSWLDFVAYSAGFVACLALDRALGGAGRAHRTP